MNLTDTIVAISSPPFDADLGVVRFSGEQAITIARQMFCGESAEPIDENRRIARRGKIVYTENQTAGALPAILYQMPQPRSYTGENVAEFIAPGSLAALRKIVALGCARGARLAEGGEFTWRAVMRGRMPLAAATAVANLIGGHDRETRREAVSELRGGLAANLTRARRALAECALLVEAELDFSENDLPPDFFGNLAAQIREADALTGSAEAAARRWRRRGIFVPIGLLGATNAGKSSLFNCLLAESAAIVSAEKSTTRDQLVATWTAGQFKFSLVDCPGEDFSAALGARILRENPAGNLAFALALLVIDRNNPARRETAVALQKIPRETPTLIVLNKCDLPAATAKADWRAWLAEIAPSRNFAGVIEISAVRETGIDELRKKIVAIAARDNFSSPDYHERELSALRELSAALARARTQIAEQNLELLAIEIRAAHELLLSLTGERYDEQVLRAIFSRLCVGK